MKVQTNAADETLVALYAQGNNEAFDILLNRYKDRLYAYIYYTVRNEELAEDIFQETFTKAIVTIQQGRYNENGKFPAWLTRIAHNLTSPDETSAGRTTGSSTYALLSRPQFQGDSRNDRSQHQYLFRTDALCYFEPAPDGGEAWNRADDGLNDTSFNKIFLFPNAVFHK